MKREFIQALVTAFIWLVCGIVAVSASDNFIVVAVALAMATGATGMIWGDNDSSLDEAIGKAVSGEGSGKRKRGEGDTKAEMLLALMDDDERQAFKRALQQQMLESSARLSDDGEIENATTLEELLKSDNHRQRH